MNICDHEAKLRHLEERLATIERLISTIQAKPVPACTAEFEQWWAQYPKKVGKQAALKAWKNAQNRPRINDLLAALARACASEQWRKDGGQFIPNPATWLNQGRWDDEPVRILPAQPKAQVKVESKPVAQQHYDPPPPEFWERVSRIGRGM